MTDHELYLLICTGENSVTECDAVILATGYEESYPFLDQSLVDTKYLFEYVFDPKPAHPKTLGIIGVARVQGPILPVAELQCRWFALLMADKLQLPTQEEMIKLIHKREENVKKNFPLNKKKIINGFWIERMDNLAQKIGATPDLVKYLFSDPILWWKLVFGPSLPYQYRLEGLYF